MDYMRLSEQTTDLYWVHALETSLPAQDYPDFTSSNPLSADITLDIGSSAENSPFYLSITDEMFTN